MSETFVSSIGQVSYPKVFRAAEEVDPSSRFKGYSVDLLVDEVPQSMKDAIEDAVNAQWKDEATRKKVLKSLTCVTKTEHPMDEDKEVWKLRFKRPTNFGPAGVVGPKLETLEEDDLYPGSFARIKYRVYTYDGDFGKGVGLGFAAVQKTGEGESFVGKNADLDGFDVID